MPMTNEFKGELLDLTYKNDNIPNVGDAAGIQGSSVDGVWYLSLHVGSPGLDGNQSTNEADYPGYSRISVPRNVTNWIRVDEVIGNLIDLLFPTNTGPGSNNIDYCGVGFSPTGSGYLRMFGELQSPILIGPGVPPKFKIGEFTVTAD